MNASDRSSLIRARNLRIAICLAAALSCSSARSASSLPPADPAIHKAPTWQPPRVAEVKAQVAAWLQKNAADAALRGKALAVVNGIGDQATGSELLDRLAETFALVDPKVAQLVEACSHVRTSGGPPVFAWLADAKTAPLVAANMRLYYGRWLVGGQWFEEALDQFGSLKAADVVAPAELLFYQGVCYHGTLNKEEGLKVIGQLLDGAETSPRRYIAVAYLMQADLNSLEKDSLDEIARNMEIARRKLDQGRAGPKVRKVEDGIVEGLDKMIKKIEEEPKDPQPGDSLNPTKPADESRPMGGKAPGDVDKHKDIGHKSGWGNMPPKEREEALQAMGRDLPPHYREIIEEYFRKSAAQPASADDD